MFKRWWQEVDETLDMKVPKATQFLLVVLITISFLNFILKYYTYFVLIKSSQHATTSDGEGLARETEEVPHPHELFVPLLTFIPSRSAVVTRPWVLLTSCFVEDNLFGLSLSFILLVYLGTYLESIWGYKEYTKYVVLNAVIVNLVILVHYKVKSLIFHPGFTSPVVLSSMAINMSLLVALKQRIGSHYLILFKRKLRVKVTFVPFLFLVGLFGLQALSDRFRIMLILGSTSLVTSWIYLRLVKEGSLERQSYLLPFTLNRHNSQRGQYRATSLKHANFQPRRNSMAQTDMKAQHIEGLALKGDKSKQFSFYTFFPFPLMPVVRIACDLVFHILCHYNVLDENEFAMSDEVYEDAPIEDMDYFQNKLFDVSALKGAENVSAISNMGSILKSTWDWIINHQRIKTIRTHKSMNNRRKLALRELD